MPEIIHNGSLLDWSCQGTSPAPNSHFLGNAYQHIQKLYSVMNIKADTYNTRATQEYSKKTVVSMPGREAAPEHTLSGTLVLNFWPPELNR